MSTLRNAVEQGKVHHAYLFVGSRGTGKTSMAKMLAACLNCEHGPTVEPCGQCESCVAIANATSLDVIEMDAASNNSVDDIRELRESVQFAPVSGRSKVYILDEAHMLSSQAWNAFLKTLEEPPPHTIFVLATTEAQKVLPTVVDRCHRFDFARPTVEQIATVITRVAAAGVDRDRARRRRAARPPRDRLVPRRARHARAARDLHGHGRSRPTTSSRCSASPTPTCSSRPSTPSPPATPAPRWLAAARLADTGRDIAQFLKRPRGPRARPARRPDARRGPAPSCALTPDRDERLAEQAGARRRARASCACSTCWPRPCARSRTAPTRARASSSRSSRPPRPRSTPRPAR